MTDKVGDDDGPEGSESSQVMKGWGDKHELALLRSVVEVIGEAIIVTGPDLDRSGPLIEYVNPGFERMTGYAVHEAVGRSPRFLQGPNTDRAVLDRLRMALRAGQSFQGETINYRKDGTEYPVEWLITPVLDGGRIVHWIAAQRDVTERRRAEERQVRMLNELNHRVNNSLSAVQSVAAQTFRDGQRSVAEIRDAFGDRLLALSRVNILLARGYWEGAALQELAEGQLMFRRGSIAGRIDIAGPEVRLRSGAALVLGMALHELATNAARHGALSSPGGRVQLRWSVELEDGIRWLRLRWLEEGGPLVPSAPRLGFGSRLVERGLAHGINGRARLLFDRAGLRCDVDAPLDGLLNAMH
ncbi:HWE histidine kinase domain-containing protein [Dankookia rubra]|nr:HWE histidine kinase domain-containing protein [Dankookia rubra]